MATKTRHLGNCQICEGDFKLHLGKMVHHGYKRPGHGYIVGDCPGVFEVPYEVSCELIKAQRILAKEYQKGQEARLEALESGKVTYIRELKPWMHEPVEYVVGVTDPYWMQRAIEEASSEVKNNIWQVTQAITRYTQRIDEWKPQVIRTVEEDMAMKKAASEKRAAEVQARREEKLKKQTAIKAKRDALEAQRQAVRDEFTNGFNLLAAKLQATQDKAEQDAIKQEAFKLASKLRHTKKYKFIWVHDLKCDAAFITLGLATKTDSGFPRYHYPL